MVQEVTVAMSAGFDDHPVGSLGVFAQPYPGATNLSRPKVLFALPSRFDRRRRVH